MFHKLFFLISIVFYVTYINGLSFTEGYVKLPSFLTRNTNIRTLDFHIKHGSKKPIVVDGDHHFVQEALDKFALDAKKKVYDISYDELIKTVPHLCGSDNIIYVYDFLPKQLGRIFNEYEIQFMQGLCTEKNLIVLGTKEIEKIPFKDDLMLKSYNYIKFPTIHRKYLVLHIKNMIEKNGYDEYLSSLPWDIVPLEHLNFEMINILVHDLAMLRQECPTALVSLDSLSFTINDMKAFHSILKDFKY